MVLIECNSGRTYLLELGTAILDEMSPKVTEGLDAEIMAKFSKFAQNTDPESLENMSDWEAMSRMDLTEEEWTQARHLLDSDEMGPSLLKKCLRKVDGQNPTDIINPYDDNNYTSVDEFVDRDEELVDDLPELMEIIKEKLTRYHAGLISKGELRSSSSKGARKTKR